MPPSVPVRTPVAAIGMLLACSLALAEGTPAPAGPPPAACETAQYRQFDFWIGTWDVTEGGVPAGRNEIRGDLSGCALFESWTAVDNTRGRSVNFYDRDRRRWHQTWVDDRGGVLELDGGIVNGRMVLEQSQTDPRTRLRVRQRITWTPNPDGSVRQHWEVQKGPGTAWKTVFDGTYKRAT
jgi:hypothetical protein